MEINTSKQQAQIDREVTNENYTRVNYDYIIGYRVMLRKHNDFKYETPFKGPYETFQIWTNRNVTIKMGAVTDRLNIQRVKPYKILEVDTIRSSTEFF